MGEDVLLAEAEKYHDLLFLWVYSLVHRQEGKIQKSANVRALPRGGGCWKDVDTVPVVVAVCS